MYSVHVNMMTLFISEPQRAVRHRANTQDKVQNVVPESEECQRPLCFFVGAKLQTMHVLYVRCFNKKRFPSLFYCLSS